MTVLGTEWSLPKRILLLTYDRHDHATTTYDHSVVGVPADRGSATKASRVWPKDWVLIRLSDFEDFRATRPARVTARAIKQERGSPYPDLLWPGEVESSSVIYPTRIPITFEGGPKTRPNCINWESLAALRFRGKDGSFLETPQQWGIKFKTNVIDDPAEVDSLVELIARCAA